MRFSTSVYAYNTGHTRPTPRRNCGITTGGTTVAQAVVAADVAVAVSVHVTYPTRPRRLPMPCQRTKAAVDPEEPRQPSKVIPSPIMRASKNNGVIPSNRLGKGNNWKN